MIRSILTSQSSFPVLFGLWERRGKQDEDLYHGLIIRQ